MKNSLDSDAGGKSLEVGSPPQWLSEFWTGASGSRSGFQKPKPWTKVGGVREAEGCEIHQPWRGSGAGGILMRN